MDVQIENIVVFVGDAVRYDYSHQQLAKRGRTYKSIAASLHTPASFGSIFSGYQVPRHGITSFREQFPKNQFNLFDLNNSSDYSVCLSPQRGMNDSIANLFPNSVQRSHKDIDPPFIWLHRDPGGHAPYGEYDRVNGGYTKGDNSTEYLNRVIGQIETFRDDYRRGVDESIEYFDEVVTSFADRGLKEDTLFIYTSDHGEILGEHGFLGHNHLGCPELVYVPTTFVHPEIESTHTDQLLHNADITPTILDILGLESLAPSLDGFTADNKNREIGYNHFENMFYTSGLDRLERTVKSVWDQDGGRVYVEGGLLNSASIFSGLLVKSPHGRQIRASGKTIDALRRFSDDRVYGNPQFSEDRATKLCLDINSKKIDQERRELSQEELDHLSDLGYV